MADKITPSLIGNQFIETYYKRMHEHPETLHKFYQEESSLIYGFEAPQFGSSAMSGDAVTGIAAIKEKLHERVKTGWVVSLDDGNVDAQSSHDGGVFLMVTGTLHSKEGPPLQFVQSFFLAEKKDAATASKSFFVLNDTFRVVGPALAPPMPPAAAAAAAAAENAVPSQQPPSAAPAAPKPAKTQARHPPAAPAPAPNAASTLAKEAPPASGSTPAPTPTPPVKAASQEASVAAAAAPVATPAPAAAPAPAPTEPKKPASWADLAAKNAPPAAAASAAPRAAPKPRAAAAPLANGGDGAAGGGGAPPVSGTPATTKPGPAGGAGGGVKPTSVTTDEVPSSACFVKNLDSGITDAELKDLFAQFLTDQSTKDKILVAEHYARGFAFVDLGSQEAVVRAVLKSRTEGGLKHGEKRLTVEPSKKPVRPSGLKAMSDRRTPSSSSSSAAAASAGGGAAGGGAAAAAVAGGSEKPSGAGAGGGKGGAGASGGAPGSKGSGGRARGDRSGKGGRPEKGAAK